MDLATDSRSQTERAYHRLRAEILHGELMPGEKLRVVELQDRFHLGLTPIREGLMRLASEGLVATETHRTAHVTTASPAEFADLMATRREIEALCLTKALAHGDAAWEAEIVASLHLLSRTPLPDSPQDREAATAWEVQHRRFHRALVAACPSAWMLKFWSTLADHSERYRKIRVLHHHEANALVRDANAEHKAISEAAVARDVSRTCALMDAHLLATTLAVSKFLNQDKDVPYDHPLGGS